VRAGWRGSAPGLATLTRYDRRWLPRDVLLGISVAAIALPVMLVFFNVDYFCEHLRAAMAASKTPVEWVIVDASPINWVNATAVQCIDELQSEGRAGDHVRCRPSQAVARPGV
jgi:MFS superfamily sulfate permease-like transporter